MNTGGTMGPRISIITLGVVDMARAIEFYRNGLGFPTNISGAIAEWTVKFQRKNWQYPKGLPLPPGSAPSRPPAIPQK